MTEIDAEINKLEENEISFTPSGCAKCRQKLEKHFIGFMCQHIFHTQCAGCEDGHYFCPICGDCTSPDLPPLDDDNLDSSIDTSKSDMLPQIISMISEGVLDR